MKFLSKKIGISTYIALLVVSTQTLLYIAFTMLILHGNALAVEESEKETFKLLGATIKWSIQEEMESAALSVASIVEDPQVKKLFAGRERQELQRYLTPLFDKIKDKVVRFHFHLPDGVSFLRMHSPESFGDPIGVSRPMIRSALALRTTISGIEQGRDGLGLRVVAPIFKETEFIGAVEYGMEFGGVFMRRLQEKYEGDYYLFLFDADSRQHFVAGTRPSDRCPLAERSLAELLNGTPVWSLECAEAKAIALYPFCDYQGKVIGFIKAELMRIPLADAVERVQKRLILLGILLLVILSISVSLAMHALLRPLRSVVRRTREISDRIIGGDVEYRGDVATTSPDFRDIISAVNDIIGALRHRENLLQSIVEGIPSAVFYVAADSRVLWANRQALSIMPGIVGADTHLISHPLFEREQELLSAVFFSGEITCLEGVTVLPRGTELFTVFWEHVGVPVFGISGEVEHVVRISTDVSEKRKALLALEDLNINLEQRINEETDRRKEGERIADLQSRLASIGELATGMAHEITQPLNAVGFSVENLRSRYVSGTIDDMYFKTKIDAITADIDRVRRVIDHVRLFARSAPEGYRVAFAVNKCIENSLALIGVQLATHGVDIKTELAGDLPELTGNPYQYEQVMLNLLSNARDAIEERLIRDAEMDNDDPLPGRIGITTRKDGQSVVLEVHDNGIGIRQDLCSRVFDPFFTTKPPGRGTGLGLSISFGIIAEMQGEIILKPAENGTIATVIVPVCDIPEGES